MEGAVGFSIYNEVEVKNEKSRLLEQDFVPPGTTDRYYYQSELPTKKSLGSLLNNATEWQSMRSSVSGGSEFRRRNIFLGPCLAFMSGTFFTLSSAGVKALTSINPMELLVIRSSLQVAVMVAIALYKKENFFGPKGFRILLQLQGLVGGLTLVLLFFTFRRLPLGDATAIIFSSPVFVMVLSFIILREPCGFFRTFIICLLLAGVTLIAKPPFIFQFFTHVESESYDVLGYISALLATLFTALNIVIMRKCKEVHFSVVVLQLSLWSLVSAAGLMILFNYLGEPLAMPTNWEEWLLTALVSFLGLAGQILVARALGLEGAGTVSVIRSLDIILAFILQVTFFKEIPDWMSGLGATAVLACVTGMTFERQIMGLCQSVP